MPRANADYVLFAGLTPVAVVEAKRKQINIADRIPQAERYARDFAMRGELAPPTRPPPRSQAGPTARAAISRCRWHSPAMAVLS